MPKLSVYVPDDLWNRARSHSADTKTSQLVQEALRRMVGDREPPFAVGSADGRQRVASVAAQKAAEARDVYENGYRGGLELASEWPWEALDWLADRDFDPEKISEAADSPEWYAGPEEVLDPSDLEGRFEDVVYSRGALFKLGLRRALRDVWEAVLRGGDATGEGADGGPGTSEGDK